MTLQPGTKSDAQPKRRIRIEINPARRILGEIVLLGLFLILDVVAVWPYSRLLALLGGIAGFSAVLFGVAIRWWAAMTASFALIVWALFWVAGPTHESPGLLQPGDDPMPNTSCVSVPFEAFYALLGRAVFYYPGRNTSMVLISNRAAAPILAIDRTYRGIAITTPVYDTKGALIGAVDQNSFRALTGDNSYVRRGDLSTLAIYDGQGDELLYVRYANQRTIRIRGTFMGSVKVVFSQDQIRIGSGIVSGAQSCMSVPTGFILP